MTALLCLAGIAAAVAYRWRTRPRPGPLARVIEFPTREQRVRFTSRRAKRST